MVNTQIRTVRGFQAIWISLQWTFLYSERLQKSWGVHYREVQCTDLFTEHSNTKFHLKYFSTVLGRSYEHNEQEMFRMQDIMDNIFGQQMTFFIHSMNPWIKKIPIKGHLGFDLVRFRISEKLEI